MRAGDTVRLKPAAVQSLGISITIPRSRNVWGASVSREVVGTVSFALPSEQEAARHANAIARTAARAILTHTVRLRLATVSFSFRRPEHALLAPRGCAGEKYLRGVDVPLRDGALRVARLELPMA